MNKIVTVTRITSLHTTYEYVKTAITFCYSYLISCYDKFKYCWKRKFNNNIFDVTVLTVVVQVYSVSFAKLFWLLLHYSCKHYQTKFSSIDQH